MKIAEEQIAVAVLVAILFALGALARWLQWV